MLLPRRQHSPPEKEQPGYCRRRAEPAQWGEGELRMNSASGWDASWAWSVPLIVLTVILHVLCLGLFNVKMVQVLTAAKERGHFILVFSLSIGITTFWAIFLHAIEAGIWAAAYRLLGALPDNETAMAYSLGAITTYGHAQILPDRWRLMGALEALNGIILIGLTTALMYGLIQRVWPVESRSLSRMPRLQDGSVSE
jgi:hypothetical protein